MLCIVVLKSPISGQSSFLHDTQQRFQSLSGAKSQYPYVPGTGAVDTVEHVITDSTTYNLSQRPFTSHFRLELFSRDGQRTSPTGRVLYHMVFPLLSETPLTFGRTKLQRKVIPDHQPAPVCRTNRLPAQPFAVQAALWLSWCSLEALSINAQRQLPTQEYSTQVFLHLSVHYICQVRREVTTLQFRQEILHAASRHKSSNSLHALTADIPVQAIEIHLAPEMPHRLPSMNCQIENEENFELNEEYGPDSR
jgi:hypothetical protein